MLRLLATLAAAYAQNAKLVVVAQFKNEAESLPQWLDHYLTDEGVAAMLLIDDNSTDSWRQAVEPYNYATALLGLRRFEEARSLWRKTMPVARRVLGESNGLTLGMRNNYAAALSAPGATLDDLHEAVTTLEDTERTARRVLGGNHPVTLNVEGCLRALRQRPPPAASNPSGTRSRP